MHDPVTPTAAAALIVVRGGDAEVPRILLLKRGSAARFMPEAYVFPGGAVDPADSTPEVYALCAGPGDAAASLSLRLSADGLKFFVAAVRETFEECGLLLVTDADGRVPDLGGWETDRLAALRASLGHEYAGLAALCAAHGWRPAVGLLTYFAHWITPQGLPRRFDTRFFIARAPANQPVCLVGEEMSDLLWVPASDALREQAAGRLKLMLPTRTLLAELAAFDTVGALFAHARAARRIEPVMPSMRDLGPADAG
jgi:8-oxo-dGTP pyrophosphatase MutT (NUDIX family)